MQLTARRGGTVGVRHFARPLQSFALLGAPI